MSSHKSLFSKTLAKRAKLDGEEKQGDSTLGSTENSGASTSVRKPAFNPALLDSAFYTGPVSYGGAGISVNSSSYNPYTTSKFYDKKKIDIKVIPSKTEATVGQIAKTICECLESYSSPISDAKRVPVNNRPPFSSHGRTFNNSSIFDTSRRYLLSESSTPSRPHRSRELQIPSIAALSKIKKTNRCNNARAAIMASMSSSLPCEPKSYKLRSDEGTSAYKSKIKTKINTVRGTKSDEEEMAQPVHLHNISLNITSLPTFSESPFSLTTSTKYSVPEKKDSSSPVSATNVVPIENNFKFTSPVHTRRSEISKSFTKFNFSEPVDIFNPKQIEMLAKSESEKVGKETTSSKEVNNDNRTSITGGLKFSKPETPPIFTNFKAGDAKVNQKTDKPSTELWNGIDSNKKNTEKSPLLNGDIQYSDYGKRSHSDSTSESTLLDSDENANIKKIKSDPPVVSSGGLESFIKKQQQQWECSSCMTRNEQSKDKCICCEASKPGAASAKPSVSVSAKASTPGTTSFSGFGNFMKKQQEQWECSSCMTRNEQSKDKCVCCETPRPGAPPSSSSSSSSTGFASFMKKQQEQWECSSCMSRNDQNRNKCACCEAPKPGSEPPAAAAVTFNFGNPQNTFKFGIDKATESPKTGVSDSKTSEIKPLETVAPVTGFTFGTQPSADNKTGNGSIAGFKFGVPDTKLAETNTIPKPSFAFGDKKETTSSGTTPVGGFTFGIKSSENTSLPGSSTTDGKTSGFSFGSVQKDNEAKKETLNTSAVTETEVGKDAKSLLTSKVEATNTTSSIQVPSDPKPTFTFNTQPKAEFSSKQFQFGTPSSKPSTDTFTPTKPFSFGQNTLETKPNNDMSSPKSSFQLPSNTGNLFPSTNSASSQGADAKVPSVLTGVQFQSSPSVEKPKDQPPSAYFTFGSAASGASNSANTFKSPVSNVPQFSFGSANTSKPEGSTLFNTPTTTSAPVTLFGAKPTTEQSIAAPPNPLFKPSTTTTPTFGSASATNIFKPSTDSTPPSANVFGSNALNQSAAKPPPALFGASPLTSKPNVSTTQNTTSPFSNPSAPSFGSGNIFGNTASSNTISPSPGNMFGAALSKPAENATGIFSAQPSAAPANIFGSSLGSSATSQQSTNPMFGSSPAVPTPVFGASIPFGEASQNQAQQNVSFKFGSPSSSQPPVMAFGQAPAAGSSAPIFSFGSGSAAPPTNSQFNFSMGAPSTAFSTPGLTGPRRFKKAVRRNNVR